MFGDRVTSSSDSFGADAPSHDPSPDPECTAANTFFLRELCQGGWSFSIILSLFWPQEAKAVELFLADITCEGGGTHRSTIMQSQASAWEA